MSEGASKIYTKGGDKGKTSLIGGSRVSKAHPRLAAYGTVDELNSVLGLLNAELKIELNKQAPALSQATTELTRIQRELFNVGSQLACEDESVRAGLPGVDSAAVGLLELTMDKFSSDLKPLKHFVLPGGTRAASMAHVARTICRRAERLVVELSPDDDPSFDPVLVRYLNRLSDYLFVLARHINRLAGCDEPIWEGKQKG